jgi:hypothetical protein
MVYWTFVILILLVQRVDLAYGAAKLYLLEVGPVVTTFNSVFDPTQGFTVFQQPTGVDTPDGVEGPFAITLDGAGNLLFLSRGRLDRYDDADNPLDPLPLISFTGEEIHPADAAFGGSNLYVLDANTHKVTMFSSFYEPIRDIFPALSEGPFAITTDRNGQLLFLAQDILSTYMDGIFAGSVQLQDSITPNDAASSPSDQLYVLDVGGANPEVQIYPSPFTGSPLPRSVSVSVPGARNHGALAVDAAGTLFVIAGGSYAQIYVKDRDVTFISAGQPLRNVMGAPVEPLAAAVRGADPIVVNAFLRQDRVFTAIERSISDNDPHHLCPETDPNDRNTWRIFAINPEFTNISQVSLRGLQYVVRTLSGRNTLINADDAPPAGGVGSTVTVPDRALGPNGILSPGESFLIVRQTEGEPLGIFLVCLASRSPFQFFVDVLGIPVP